MALVFHNPPISPHFHLSEVLTTNVKDGVSKNHGALFASHTCLFNVISLAHTLEFIRERVLNNEPIFINSWFRSPFVNRAVGGVPNSLHLLGRAVDIRCDSLSAEKLYMILSTHFKGRFAELILYPNFVHLAIHPVKYGKEIVLP